MANYVYTMNRVGKIVPPKRQILKDISLSFFPGAKIGVLGLNGSGKSTLLKIMAGIDKDIEGEAIPMPNLKIGYLPQEPQLDPTMTVRQAVESGLGEAFEVGIRLGISRIDGVELGARVRPGHHTAHAYDGKARAQRLAQGADHAVAGLPHGRS